MTVNEIIARAESLRKEIALNSVDPERVGSIMSDTLKWLNEFQLTSNSLALEKIYASVSAMNSDNTPVSDLTGKPLKGGQLAVIVAGSASEDNGKVYRFDNPGWTYVSTIGNLNIVQETGDSETAVMSQKAVTDLIEELKNAGYVFAGIATPETNPSDTAKVFYVASENGTYSNFDGIVLLDEIAILYRAEATWIKALVFDMRNFVDSIAKIKDDLLQKLTKDNKSESIIRDLSDAFWFTDKDGNAVCKIDKSGVEAHNIREIKDSSDVSVFRDASDVFYFCDAEGNVICKIDKDGLHSADMTSLKDAISQIIANGTWNGKEFYVVGDSVCASRFGITSPYRSWIPKFAELTGATFDLEYNADGISVGGTQTIQGNAFAGQMRMRRLLSEKSPKILFYENINDALTQGAITDEPFMMSGIIDLDTPVQESQLAARSYFQDNLASIAESIEEAERKHGIVLRQPYNSQGLRMTLSGSVTQAGTIELQLPSSVLKGIAVNVGDSIEDIVDKIVEYSYENWDDAKESSSSVVFSPNNPSVSVATATIDTGNTGITFSQEIVENAVRYEAFYFVSHQTAQWANADSWKLSSAISYYSAIKGLIEFVQTHAPECMFVLLGFPRFSFNFDAATYKRADGTYDIDAFKAAVTAQATQLSMQKEIAQYMQVFFADVPDMWGVTVYNGSTYFNNSNVHPKPEGYDRYAEALYSIMFNFQN